MASATVEKYVCTCYEKFDDDTGISEGCFECIGCAADSGYCTCKCDCGQCLYTETPCGYVPSNEPCELCIMRQEWDQADVAAAAATEAAKAAEAAAKAAAEVAAAKDPLSEVSPIIAEVKLIMTHIKDDLATAHVPGRLSHENLRLKLSQRYEPCLFALNLVEDKSEWASSVIDEVKNLLNLGGRSGVRKYCSFGLAGCMCHLRTLNTLLAEKVSDELKSLNREIASSEDACHLTRGAANKAWEAMEAAKFEKRIAEDMVDEHVWEKEADPSYGTPGELKELREELERKQAARLEAEEFYRASTSCFNSVRAEFHVLMERKAAILGAN